MGFLAMSAAPKRIAASTLVALAIACAGASCQRATEGAACPCLAGYQCCQTEQACYPEEMRCPSAVPGALIWTATGFPTFDQAGNVYVDQPESAEQHAISRLDVGTGQPRWTQRGFLELRCSTDDAAVLMEWPGTGDVPWEPRLRGVSGSDGSERWSLRMNWSAHTHCADAGDRLYAVQPSALTLITSGGEINGTVPIGVPDDELVMLRGAQDDLALLSWEEVGGGSALAAVELAHDQPGRVRWRTHLNLAESWFSASGKIFALTFDSTNGNRSLVRLSPADGNPMWTLEVGDSAFPALWTPEPWRAGALRIASPWAGIVVLRVGAELLAVAEGTGAASWTFPLTESGFAMSEAQIPPSGDLLIRYDSSTSALKLYKLVNRDGAMRWIVGPYAGSLIPTADEYYLLEPGFISRIDPDSGDRVWTFICCEDPTDPIIFYPREVVGYDEEHVFVRTTTGSGPTCNFCEANIVALARSNGARSWKTDWLFTENYHQFFRFHVAGPRLFVFAQVPGALRTGTLWAFWR
jgi:outer membrane protein assembly factor BamB